LVWQTRKNQLIEIKNMSKSFKIKKCWIITLGMIFFSLVSLAQDCPPIVGAIKPTSPPLLPGNCLANVFASPTFQTIFSGQSTAVALTSNASGTTYNWTVTQIGLTGAISGNGNIIAQTLTTIGSQTGVATYLVTPTLGNCSGTPINIVINVETLYKNIAKSGSFTRDNCGAGGTGTTVAYTVPANTYSSTSSQTDADTQAQNDVNANGQAYANANATCSYFFTNAAKSGSFTRNNCGTGGTGTTVTYTVAANTYSSTSSQADADTQAQNDVNANGQAYANANGTCSYFFTNIAKSGSFTRNNCGTGGTGTTVTYTVAANIYSSTSSQADADAQAQNDVNVNGQAYANANGTCSYFFTNTTKSGSFTRNNCETGGTGTTITYNVPANTYSSTSSQADADAQAQNDVNNNAQAYANANGTCSYFFTNTAKSGAFTRNNCGTGGKGSTVIYTIPANTYSSTLSQADADLKAQNALNANGQTYANANGTCSYSGNPASIGLTPIVVTDHGAPYMNGGSFNWSNAAADIYLNASGANLQVGDRITIEFQVLSSFTPTHYYSVQYPNNASENWKALPGYSIFSTDVVYNGINNTVRINLATPLSQIQNGRVSVSASIRLTKFNGVSATFKAGASSLSLMTPASGGIIFINN
jgi:20S proteasome alpha/beta subunit